jgi:hypothetical protein
MIILRASHSSARYIAAARLSPSVCVSLCALCLVDDLHTLTSYSHATTQPGKSLLELLGHDDERVRKSVVSLVSSDGEPLFYDESLYYAVWA